NNSVSKNVVLRLLKKRVMAVTPPWGCKVLPQEPCRSCSGLNGRNHRCLKLREKCGRTVYLAMPGMIAHEMAVGIIKNTSGKLVFN
ncbi:MAG: hypothetical protein ACF8OB_12330, partial [Phycisphaeraceae bacterium JB051]